MDSLPLELLHLIDQLLGTASRISLRLVCKSFNDGLMRLPITPKIPEYNEHSLCERKHARAHLQENRERTSCRLCGHRYPNDVMFTASRPQHIHELPNDMRKALKEKEGVQLAKRMTERLSLQRDFILRHRCAYDGGVGSIPVPGTDICDHERYVFVRTIPTSYTRHTVPVGHLEVGVPTARRDNQPRDGPTDSPWVLRRQPMCFHCHCILEPWRGVCNFCECSSCSVRGVMLFLRKEGRAHQRPTRYAIYREDDGSYWAAEWYNDHLRQYRIELLKSQM